MTNESRVLVGSTLWYYGIAAAVAINLCGTILLYNLSERQRENFRKYLGIFILSEFLATNFYQVFILQTWSVAYSLPLHLCRLSLIIIGFALLTKNQLLYEWGVYLGIPGGFHSVLTPELTYGESWLMLFDYYCLHSLLIFVPLALSIFYEMKPRKGAMLRIFLYVNVLVLILFPLNFLFGSNYMYLARKPTVENPLIIGDWPCYIIGMEIFGFMHLLLMDIMFRVRPLSPNYALRTSNSKDK